MTGTVCADLQPHSLTARTVEGRMATLTVRLQGHLEYNHKVTAGTQPRSRHALPPGYYYSKQKAGIVTTDGVRVPIVDHPLVGTDEERDALARLREEKEVK